METLAQERRRVLAWAVRGAIDWYKQAPDNPSGLIAAHHQLDAARRRVRAFTVLFLLLFALACWWFFSHQAVPTSDKFDASFGVVALGAVPAFPSLCGSTGPFLGFVC